MGDKEKKNLVFQRQVCRPAEKHEWQLPSPKSAPKKMSKEILAEIKDILSRPRLRMQNADLTDEKVERLIEMILEKSDFIKKVPPHFTYSRDLNDEPYINLAIEANALFLVSRDNDLLDLMPGYTDECKDFRRRFRKLKIVNPVEFLVIVQV